MLVRALRTCVVLRNRPLILAEDIDPEALLGVQVGMGARGVVHADQHQHGVERNGCERIGGHAMNFAVEIHGDNRDPSGEASHSFAEFGVTQAHVVEFLQRDCLH